MVDWQDALIGLFIGAALGAALTLVAVLLKRGRLHAELADARARRTAGDERLQVYQDAEIRLKETFRAAGAEALAANNQQFLDLARKTLDTVVVEARGDVEKRREAIDALVQPLRETLIRQQQAVANVEKQREAAYSGLQEQIKAIAASHEKLSTQTGRLVSALRRPEQRGRWGELQLRNVVELAGMTAHCDFVEQPTVRNEDDRYRPDMIVKLPGGGVIVVDAKCALDAYLDSIQPDADRNALLQRHAQLVTKHYRKLAEKRYWDHFERTPKVVVMFMPLEPALIAALEVNPNLHADAMKSNVLIATPVLLVALLRAVAFGWQQEDVAANAREISRVGRDLYDRLGKFVEHFTQMGDGLEKASKSYNRAVGSLERRVLPATRDLRRLHATTDAEVPAPRSIIEEVRGVTAVELTGENAETLKR